MATKNYYIGPEDGWVQIVTTTAKASVRISAFPHTQPFYVFADATATPSASDVGIRVCHKPFCVDNYTSARNVEKFYIRVVESSESSRNADGKTRFDVHADGAALV